MLIFLNLLITCVVILSTSVDISITAPLSNKIPSNNAKPVATAASTPSSTQPPSPPPQPQRLVSRSTPRPTQTIPTSSTKGTSSAKLIIANNPIIKTTQSIKKLKSVPKHKLPKVRGQNTTRTAKEIEKAARWLEQFGYLGEFQNSGETMPPELDFQKALRKLQRYARLPVTGVLDDATINQMNKPRCGNRDFNPDGTRFKRYILLRRRWQRGREIDIQFRNHTPDMTIAEQEAVMQHAVDQWNAAGNANLVFHPNGEQIEFPEINIHHTRYDYLGRPFSPYGVLAYAALPRNGDMFFDDTESWSEYHSFRPPYKFSYKTVALHELGHSLGFAHSDVPSAVMYAFYGPTRHTLTSDDIAGAVAMFGPN